MMESSQSAIAFAEAHPKEIALGIAVLLLTLVGSLAVVAILLVRLPADYLDAPEDAPFWPGRPAWQRALARIGKNVLGVLLILVGILLSIPGIPGQGVLTILIGTMLLDLPGKRRLERRILGRPRMLAAVNGLRARFGRAPLAPAGSTRRTERPR